LINTENEIRYFLLSPSTNSYESWHGYILILDHLNGAVYKFLPSSIPTQQTNKPNVNKFKFKFKFNRNLLLAYILRLIFHVTCERCLC